MLGLRTAIYKVNDLAAAKKWYAELFRTEPYFDEPFYCGFEIGGFELGLIPDPAEAVGDNVLVYWGVEDIKAEHNRCIELGASTYEAPHNVGGDIEVAGVKDPWGNIIGLIYNPYFKMKG